MIEAGAGEKTMKNTIFEIMNKEEATSIIASATEEELEAIYPVFSEHMEAVASEDDDYCRRHYDDVDAAYEVAFEWFIDSPSNYIDEILLAKEIEEYRQVLEAKTDTK